MSVCIEIVSFAKVQSSPKSSKRQQQTPRPNASTPKPCNALKTFTIHLPTHSPSTLKPCPRLSTLNPANCNPFRFFCVWDDRQSMYGDQRKFVLRYYLADDTMDMVEEHVANSGRK